MRRIAVLLAAIAAFAVAGCGGDDEPAATPAPTEAATEAPTEAATEAPTEAATEAAAGGSELKIAADPGGAKAFTETALTADAGKVTVEFANESQLPHAVEIEGNGVEETTETVTGADAPPLTVDLKPGEYTYYCPVGDHRAEGMEGKLTVR
jgi:plastocyanin